MKRLKLMLLLQGMFLTTAIAGNYKILYLNSNQIWVNGKPAKVGGIFDDNAVIRWSQDRQAMKVLDTKTNTRYLMVARLSEGKELSAYQILTRNKHLSTHDDTTPMNEIIKLRMSLADQYDLLDVIEIQTDLKVDDSHYFLCSFEYGDTKLTKKLNSCKGKVMIDKSIFYVDGEKLDPRDVSLTISYVNGNPDNPIFVKRFIEVTIIPEKL